MTTVRSAPALVHICGFPSSGTDLLSNFMSAHPDIHVRGEFPMLYKLADFCGATISPARLEEAVSIMRSGDVYGGFLPSIPAPAELQSGEGDSISVASLYAALLTRRDVRWCGNKTPQNTEHIGELLRLFPESRFVFISRDIRDVCLSWNRKWGKDMLLCAQKWNDRMLKGIDTMSRLPDGQVLQIHFEDLTAAPADVGLAIARFLDVPPSENFAQYQRHVQRVADGKRNFGAAIDPANKGKWKEQLAPDLVKRIEEIALPAMQRLGYRPRYATCHRRLTTVESLKGIWADTYAALAVGNRYRARNRLRDRLRKLAIIIRCRIASI